MRNVLLTWCLVFVMQTALGQSNIFNHNGQQNANQDNRIRHTEFAIPVSPAFSMLNADPSIVTMPSTVRDFKVDWSFKTYRLSPNLCLEATPLWTLGYDRPQNGYKAYQKAGWFMRRLSSLNFSLGTIQLDTNRQMAWAVKINLYTQKDFYATKEVFDIGNQDLAPMRDTAAAQLARLENEPDTSKTDGERFDRAYKIFMLEAQLQSVDQQMKDRTNFLRNIYMRRFWNSASVDFCVGKTYLYFSESLDDMRLQQEGIGAWITGGFGMGKKWFLSGLLKQINFSNVEYSIQRGVNLRYGGLRFQFFVEGIAEDSRLKKTNPDTGDKFMELTKSLTMAYGGMFRIGSNVALSFGVRTIYDRQLVFKSLLPVANISCLMR